MLLTGGGNDGPRNWISNRGQLLAALAPPGIWWAALQNGPTWITTQVAGASRCPYPSGVATGDLEARVRAICMALPEVTERLSHGAPGFFAGKQFVMLWPDGHHDHQFPHLWCAAPAGAQEGLIAATQKQFFVPPYVGSRGWLGVRLDSRVRWKDVEAVCEDAYRTVASKRLLALLHDIQVGKNALH